MIKESTINASFWDRLTDGFSTVSEGVSKWMTRLMGSSNERYITKLGYIRARSAQETHTVVPGSLLAQINELEPQMLALSEEELKGTTPLRAKLAGGATLDTLLPEAFAACREAGQRTKNMRHFDAQMLGGIVLHRGNIAEMVTGEGKTLVATLPAYLNALEGKGVHVITVNDYLARRDCEWMMPDLQRPGHHRRLHPERHGPRRPAHRLRLRHHLWHQQRIWLRLSARQHEARRAGAIHNFDPYYHQCQKPLNYAIIDEVDNILIDEARTPLIISGPAFSDVRRFTKANDVAVATHRFAKARTGPSITRSRKKNKPVHLTDDGIHKAEELAGVESFYTAGNMEWPHLIDNALKAHHLYKKDKRYAVMHHPETGEMSIIIIDEFTGRLMIGRQWSDGLHQAVEAKHARDGVKIKEETQTLATITLQNFFKLYEKLAGMTGTAMTEANEFWKIYKLEVIAIPTNKPLIRINHPM